jgi:[NiFe] hydrogenase diaphorase moiety small subunit
VRASRELDGKAVFGFTGRGSGKRLACNAESGLGGTSAAADDRAIAACPTGSLLLKRTGYAVPVGRRRFDRLPIGADIELPTAGE